MRISSSFISLFLLHLLILLNRTRVHLAAAADDDYIRADFPPAPAFVFGAASSAYQVEGAAFEDGRTASIWDTFAHTIYNSSGEDGDVACDMYHKYKEDVQLMVKTGLDAFRFSISWSRLIPNGTGAINPKGLQYYNNLINELISHGIEPHVTLFHYDLPQVLEDDYAGWLSRQSVQDFVAYADVCFREFGDRVLYWTTFNEANIYALGGYDEGSTPPGRCSYPYGNCTSGNSTTELYIVVHNMLLAHASAARLYQKKYQVRQHGFIGLNAYVFGFVPYTNSKEDESATQRAKDYIIGWTIHPLVFGDYPESMKKNSGPKLPTFTESESKLVQGSFDFIGLNQYTTYYVKDKTNDLQMNMRDLLKDMEADLILVESMEMQLQQLRIDPSLIHPYPIIPWGLQGVLEYLKSDYGNPPVYIHENGQLTNRSTVLNDTSRVQYHRAFIGGVLDAIRNGSDTRGYFAWSFLDSFELLDGYNIAYGLYAVDLNDTNMSRYSKLSAKWYTNFLKGGNINYGGKVMKERMKELKENVMDQ